MSGELAASFVLKLNDQGSAAAERALKIVERALKSIGETSKTTSNVAISAFQKLANARETLGIRSEKLIQNEIRQTEAAYKRLVNSGQAGARELSRAQESMKQKVSALRQEMDGVNRSASRLPALMRGAGAAAAAWQAGKYVLGKPVGETMAYDRALAMSSNTAFAGQSLDARRAGMRTLDTAVVGAAREGATTREAALAGLDKMVASGSFNVSEATALLPTLTKAQTASGASVEDLAQIANRAKGFGITNVPLALDQAMKAGQLGGFELKDMARYLPSQMAAAKLVGLRGDNGLRTLLALNQAAATSAGTPDEAGNNVLNLLTKVNSQDTAKDFKKHGIDLSGSLAASRASGGNPIDTFMSLVMQVAAKDKGFGEINEKAKNAKGQEQVDMYGSMADILIGKGIGMSVQDRQALMALLGAYNNQKYMVGMRDNALVGAGGTMGSAFDLMSETPSVQVERLALEKAIAMQNAMDKVNPVLGRMAEALSGVMREWPVFAAAIVGGGIALTTLAASAGAASVALLALAGGGSVTAGAGKVASGIAGLFGFGVGGSLATIGGGSVAAGAGIAAGGVAIAGGLGYAAGSVAHAGLAASDKYIGTTFQDDIGRLTAILLAGFGNKEAQQALEINLNIDGEKIASVVTDRQSRTAKRQ